MEWKIGEIRQVNDEWYQCVIATHGCDGCSFRRPNGCASEAECFANIRADHKSVIFKRLEKVGEPYYDKNYSQVLQKYIYYIPAITPDLRIHILGNNIVGIEIKQNKEDMEEKKQKMDKLVTDYSANKITYKEFEKSIVELYADKYTEVNKPNLKEFSLEAVKAGKSVCTRDGRKVRIICFDMKGGHPIVALTEEEDNTEKVGWYYDNGKYLSNGEESPIDLMMLPEKKEGWVNVYNDGIEGSDNYRATIYANREVALARKGSGCVATVKVSWNE